jgi:hypothetical protein
MTSGATTAGSTLPTEAKVCCTNIATRATNIWDKSGKSFEDWVPKPETGTLRPPGAEPSRTIAAFPK